MRVKLVKERLDVETALQALGLTFVLSVKGSEIVVDILDPEPDEEVVLQALRAAKPDYTVIKLPEKKVKM